VKHDTSGTRTFRSTEELEQELGEQVRRARLRLELSQDELARRANVSVTVVRNIERGRGGSMRSLIRIVRGLGEVDSWLLQLAPEPPLSPLDVLRARGLLRERQRAPKRTPDRNDT